MVALKNGSDGEELMGIVSYGLAGTIIIIKLCKGSDYSYSGICIMDS
jgi:hypothetical protein